MTTVAQVLADARRSGLDKLDADLLLLAARGLPATQLDQARGWLLAHDSDDLPDDVLDLYRFLVQRRQSGEPLAYITGHKEFFGLDLVVDRRVLVPRPDTETLVEWAFALIGPGQGTRNDAAPRVLDLGTGSGAIAIALKHGCPALSVEAVDASVPALRLAQSNAERLKLDIRFFAGNWFEPISGRFDLIVSNPPYVPADDRHLQALAHEPSSALVSGPDGLQDIRQIVAAAPEHLMPGGWLLLEHGYDQGMRVQDLMCQAGFSDVQARHDLAGHWRCTGGRVLTQDLQCQRAAGDARPSKVK